MGIGRIGEFGDPEFNCRISFPIVANLTNVCISLLGLRNEFDMDVFHGLVFDPELLTGFDRIVSLIKH